MSNKVKVCKNCGKELLPNSEYCLGCGVKVTNKKAVYKRWWFWAIIVLVFFYIVGSIGSCGDNDESVMDTHPTETVTTSIQETEPTTTQEPTTTIAPTTTATPTTEAPETKATEKPAGSPNNNSGGNSAGGSNSDTDGNNAPVVNYNEPVEDKGQNYVLNTNTMKFHYPSCSSAKKIKPENRGDFYGTRDQAIAKGYDSCGICHP